MGGDQRNVSWVDVDEGRDHSAVERCSWGCSGSSSHTTPFTLEAVMEQDI